MQYREITTRNRPQRLLNPSLRPGIFFFIDKYLSAVQSQTMSTLLNRSLRQRLLSAARNGQFSNSKIGDHHIAILLGQNRHGESGTTLIGYAVAFPEQNRLAFVAYRLDHRVVCGLDVSGSRLVGNDKVSGRNAEMSFSGENIESLREHKFKEATLIISGDGYREFHLTKESVAGISRVLSHTSKKLLFMDEG